MTDPRIELDELRHQLSRARLDLAVEREQHAATRAIVEKSQEVAITALEQSTDAVNQLEVLKPQEKAFSRRIQAALQLVKGQRSPEERELFDILCGARDAALAAGGGA
jgi:hypothetical protein